MKRSGSEVFVLLAATFIIVIGFITVSCNDRNNSKNSPLQQNIILNPTSAGRRLAALAPVENCDELLASFKAVAIKNMEDRIDSYIDEVNACGGCCSPWKYNYDTALPPAMATASPDGAGASNAAETDGQESASEYSTTNNQVPGVDEADFLKNDDTYIYILANNKFQIINAFPPETASVISKIDIEGTPKKLFVYSDRALIYSSLDPVYDTAYTARPYPTYAGYPSAENECVYGYDCEFTGDNNKTKITVYDISDRSNPVLVREIRFSGSYINARRIGTAIHTVILSPAFLSPNIKYWPDLWEKCWSATDEAPAPTLEELLEAFEDLKQTNRDIINQTTIADWLPRIQDIRYQDGETITTDNLLTDCSGFYMSNSSENRSLLTVFSFDIDQLEEPSQATILGRPGAVYSSSSALYVATRQEYNYGFGWYYDFARQITQATTIHKFDLKSNPAGCAYSSSGVVKGRVLNQFSMDEYDGCLRIATTTSNSPNAKVHSTLSILKEESGEFIENSEESGGVSGELEGSEGVSEATEGSEGVSVEPNEVSGELTEQSKNLTEKSEKFKGVSKELDQETKQLKIVGQVDNIAPSEDIRSVRFDGKKAFVVTFKKTDPLFAFDLSDPTAPRIEGKLEIKGFSTYMHLMDTNHLLTIGYDASDEGGFAWFQGIRLQIFDISNMKTPKLLHKVVIGTGGSSSEAAVNHLAFNYFTPTNPPNLLAIPLTICDGVQGGYYYDTEMSFSGLRVYNVTLENGFSERGDVSHVEPGSTESCVVCGTWWTQSNSIVKRSIFMNNDVDSYVYSIALDQIKIQSLDGMGTDIRVIDLLH